MYVAQRFVFALSRNRCWRRRGRRRRSAVRSRWNWRSMCVEFMWLVGGSLDLLIVHDEHNFEARKTRSWPSERNACCVVRHRPAIEIEGAPTRPAETSGYFGFGGEFANCAQGFTNAKSVSTLAFEVQ
ncbi:hypothetical protein SCHPADRAFT_745407 [Schizopora paradoxa]|uniref:Uncharacterized protein n=1 Tax=Schizopora paradoxa TaxID=27342 RepID=A0A0H2R0I5_9AGAM|nr:hypothetical protein SCHPADRAFT_745407 [Schizopora paradoxa]